MAPELGHIALILALCVALLQSVLPLAGAQARDPALMATAKPAAYAQFLLVAHHLVELIKRAIHLPRHLVLILAPGRAEILEHVL